MPIHAYSLFSFCPTKRAACKVKPCPWRDIGEAYRKTLFTALAVCWCNDTKATMIVICYASDFVARVWIIKQAVIVTKVTQWVFSNLITLPTANHNADQSNTALVWISNCHLTLKMSSAQDVETSVITNSPSQDSDLSPRWSNSIKVCNNWVQTIFYSNFL